MQLANRLTVVVVRKFAPLLPVMVVAVAWLFNFYSFMVQISPGVLGNYIVTDLQLTAVQLSILTGSYFCAYALMQIPVGMLLDRYGARRMLSMALFTCVLGQVLLARAHWLPSLAFAEFIIGASTAFAYVGALYIIANWLPLKHFGLFVGLTELVGACGAMAGETPLLHLVTTMGWRHSELVLAVIAMVLCALVSLLVRDRPEHVTVSPKNDTTEVTSSFKQVLQQLRQLLGRSQLWVIGLCAVLLWAPTITFGSLWGIPYLIREYGLTQAMAAKLTLFLWVGTALGSILIGWLSSHIRRSHVLLTIYAMLGFVATSTLLIATAPPLWLLALLLFCLGFASAGVCLTFTLIRQQSPLESRASAFGFNNMLVAIGGPCCQMLVGLILDVTWDGSIQHGIPAYSAVGFHYAMLVLPFCFVATICIVTFFLTQREVTAHPVERNRQ